MGFGSGYSNQLGSLDPAELNLNNAISTSRVDTVLVVDAVQTIFCCDQLDRTLI